MSAIGNVVHFMAGASVINEKTAPSLSIHLMVHDRGLWPGVLHFQTMCLADSPVHAYLRFHGVFSADDNNILL